MKAFVPFQDGLNSPTPQDLRDLPAINPKMLEVVDPVNHKPQLASFTLTMMHTNNENNHNINDNNRKTNTIVCHYASSFNEQ